MSDLDRYALIDHRGESAREMKRRIIQSARPNIKLIQSPKKTQRVLHLSDIHVDRDYAIGSEADCKVFYIWVIWGIAQIVTFDWWIAKKEGFQGAI